MIQENEAVVIIEEGTDVEMQTEGLGCCCGSFAWFY